MSKQNASDYNLIVEKLDPDVLMLVERSMSDGFLVPSDFEEDSPSDKKSDASDKVDWSFRWFRYITPLQPKYQRKIIIALTGRQSCGIILVAGDPIWALRQYADLNGRRSV
jgi:hypothetical protein